MHLSMQYQQHAKNFNTFCENSKNFNTFCENWVLTTSFFGRPLRSHCLIFSPQIMQGKLAYILLYENTKLFMGPIMILISRFLSPNIPYFLWTVYMLWILIKTVMMHSFSVNIRICQPIYRVDKILMLTSKECINCIMALILIGSTSRHFTEYQWHRS